MLCFLSTIFLLKKGKRMEKREKKMIIYLLLMVAVLASLPLLGNTIFAAPVMSHDTFFHTQRIWSIKNALLEGQIPVRIYSEIYEGYGYGAPLYYPDIFLYFPAVLCIVGVPLAISYNVFLILVNIATLFIAYYSYSRIAKSKQIGVLAAVFYTLSTYRFLDLYTRGAVGELLALTFCPLILCGLTLLKRGEYDKWWVVMLGYTGILQSHILSFVMLAVMGVLYALVHFKYFLNIKSIISVMKAGSLWLVLNLWFLLPFLKEMQALPVWGTPNFWSTGAEVVQLFDVFLNSVIGTEVFGGPIENSIPKTPGVLLIFSAVLLLLAMILYRDKMQGEGKRILGCLLPGILATLMVTNVFPWELVRRIPGLRGFFPKFQFMWRFNVLAILFLSLAAAYGFYYFFVKKAANRSRALVLVSIIPCLFSLIFTNQFAKQAGQFENEEVMQNGYMDMMYLAPGFDFIRDGVIESNLEEVLCTNVVHDGSGFSCQLQYETDAVQEDDAYVDVPLTYYTGYRAYLDGASVDTTCSAKGIVRVLLPMESSGGYLEVGYEDGIWVKVANIVSLLSWIVLLSYGIGRKMGFRAEGTKK